MLSLNNNLAKCDIKVSQTSDTYRFSSNNRLLKKLSSVYCQLILGNDHNLQILNNLSVKVSI